MKIQTGFPFYGQNIGILVFSTVTPRVPGDAGNSCSFKYPVCYEIVQGGFADLIEGSPEIKNNIISAAANLRDKGIRGIIGDCGMMSLYQDALGSILGIPVAASSLCQIPMVWQLIGRQGRIGIITGHSRLLGLRHLRSSGWSEEMRLSIQGMEEESHFSEIVIHGGLNIDVDRMRNDVINAAGKLQEKTDDLRAVIFECSNLATYSADIYELLHVPVFDIMSAANLLEYSVNPPRYI